MIQRFLYLMMALCALVGCGPRDAHTLKVGTISGPETELMRTAQQIAAQRYHVSVQIIEFSDYSLPNIALNDGSLDANMMQHLPYLQATIQARGFPLMAIGKTFIYPMGLYTQRIKHLNNVPNKATIAIPNDPSNAARALLLLQQAKLITLAPHHHFTDITVDTIIKNPKQLIIKTLDAAQLPRVLTDVDIAAINTNYAVAAHLNPRHALLLESKDSPYANIVAIRRADQHRQALQHLVQALHSPEVVAKAKEVFGHYAIPAW